MKVAIYARVSTDEQNEKNQIDILNQWAAGQPGWEIGKYYIDVGSAFQHADQKQLGQLLADCRQHKYERVLVYDLSRITRKGPLELMVKLKEFADAGAPVYSYLDTAVNVPSEFQPMLQAFYGAVARTFSTQLSERTKAGMARARDEGKHIGRPRGKGNKGSRKRDC